MKLKLDENLPARSAPRLRALGFDVDTVVDEGHAGKSDADVWLGFVVATPAKLRVVRAEHP